MKKLQILVPTTPDREIVFNEMKRELDKQIARCGCQHNVEIVEYNTPKGVPSIGAKRNYLLSNATAEYVAFFDSDDTPSPTYIQSVMVGIENGADCCSLRGIITFDGKNPELFEHSLRYAEWKTNTTGDIKYERNPNHLNVIKREIAQQFKYPETNHGEDHDWSTQVLKSGLIKTEHYIDEVIYNYKFIERK